MASIRTFLYPTSTDGSTPPRTLALSRKGPSILLVHPSPLSPEYPNERQHTIINALARDDPFPKPSEEGRVRIWLKEGVRGKADGEGGENVGLREALLEARIIAPTEIVANQGVMSYSLVELLVPESVFCLACEGPGCGKFETLGEVRWKRCARCRLSYYCSTACQSKDWKATHRSNCLDLPSDVDESIEQARRRTLMRFYGRIVDPAEETGGKRSKLD